MYNIIDKPFYTYLRDFCSSHFTGAVIPKYVVFSKHLKWISLFYVLVVNNDLLFNTCYYYSPPVTGGEYLFYTPSECVCVCVCVWVSACVCTCEEK